MKYIVSFFQKWVLPINTQANSSNGVPHGYFSRYVKWAASPFLPGKAQSWRPNIAM